MSLSGHWYSPYSLPFLYTSITPSLLLPCSFFLRWSTVANPSSRPPLARSGYPISHGFKLFWGYLRQSLGHLDTHFSTLSFLSFNHSSLNNPHFPSILSLFSVAISFIIHFLYRTQRHACFSSYHINNAYLQAASQIALYYFLSRPPLRLKNHKSFVFCTRCQ